MSPIQQRQHKVSPGGRAGTENKFTWRHDSSNFETVRRSSPTLMVYWLWRRWLTWKGYTDALQQSVSNPTLGCAYTPIVILPSLWCGPHTSVSRGTGFRHIRSECSACSGRTAPGLTCSDRRAGKTPNPATLPPQNTPQIYWAWRYNLTQKI